MKKLWAFWKDLAGRAGNFQARIFLTLLYFTVFMPFGIGVSVFTDGLRVKRRPSRLVWSPRVERGTDLDEARREF